MTLETREDILAEASRIAAGQPGGTLATTHAEDGTPYVTYVLFHLRANGDVLFGSAAGPQHERNLAATPEASFLIDNRGIIETEWTQFDRVIVEGQAKVVAKDDPTYRDLLEELRGKNAMAAQFTEQGFLFCLRPRRLILRKGIDPTRYIVDFEH